MITLESYTNGHWQGGSGESVSLRNPTTEEPLAEVSSQGVDLAAALSWGREQGGPALRELGFRKRGECLKALSTAIHEHRDELIGLSIQSAGTTRSDAKFDIDGATGTLAAYAHFAKAIEEDAFLVDGEGGQLGRTPRFWGQHILVPKHGIAVHINAFNFPAWNMAEKMACSLLAGMPVIEKPGTPTATLAWRVAQIIVESGLLPGGAFQFVCGGARTLLDHTGPQDCVAFTGSSRTGAHLRSNANAVRHNVHINIEADSLNAAILGPDVDADAEAYGLFLSNVQLDITQKAGQKCTAVRRILVPEERVDEVAQDLCARLERVKVGDPAERETRMGPLACAAQLEDVTRGIGRLAAEAEVLTGGPERTSDKGYFVAPTLLKAKDPGQGVFHELEVFGPCATILPYSGEAGDAIALANRSGGGLVASLYSNERGFAEEVCLGISPWHGRVWIGSDKLADQASPPGTVLPQSHHGGPGRAGGGGELGGLRGLEPYLQRTAVQGFRGWVEKAFGGAEK
jgi:oxepin-CoA hydrolase/3-oxo-5,6-dehydrosuberyl-CoA semialdehyde dehydrogenase